jgi:hypothetical protein
LGSPLSLAEKFGLTPITSDGSPTFLEPLSSVKASNFWIKDPKLAQLPIVKIRCLSPTLFQNKTKIATERKKGSRTGRETRRNGRKGQT